MVCALAVDFWHFSYELGHECVRDHGELISFEVVLLAIRDVLFESPSEVDVEELCTPTGPKHRDAFWEMIHEFLDKRKSEARFWTRTRPFIWLAILHGVHVSTPGNQQGIDMFCSLVMIIIMMFRVIIGI